MMEMVAIVSNRKRDSCTLRTSNSPVKTITRAVIHVPAKTFRDAL